MIVTHDPDAVLTYSWDWSDWLDTGDSVASATVVADPSTGVSVGTPAVAADVVSARVSTPGLDGGETVRLVCHITTDNGEEDDRTITLKIMER